MNSQHDMMQFLKKYSPVDNTFIDDFFGLYADDGKTLDGSDFVIDLGVVSRWLGIPKYNLMKTLKASYMLGVDFTVSKPVEKLKGRGRNSLRIVMLTPDCFKTLCMQSRSPKADAVRAYFIAVEKTLMRYRSDIVDSMQRRIQVLESNRRPLDASLRKTGVIYVIRVADDKDGMASRFKLGRTRDLASRLRSHASAKADALDVLFVYKTDHVVRVEACVKAVLKGTEYRKFKEIYEADIDTIKRAIDGCGDLCARVQQPTKKRTQKKETNGGASGGESHHHHKTFMVVIRDSTD